MPSKLRLSLAALGLAAAFGLGLLRAHPSLASLRQDVLAGTPKGSSMDAVRQYCRRRAWDCLQSDAAGYLDTDTHLTVGERSTWTGYDEYFLGVRTPTSVAIYWGFDAEGRLLDVWVMRSFDFF